MHCPGFSRPATSQMLHFSCNIPQLLQKFIAYKTSKPTRIQLENIPSDPFFHLRSRKTILSSFLATQNPAIPLFLFVIATLFLWRRHRRLFVDSRHPFRFVRSVLRSKWLLVRFKHLSQQKKNYHLHPFALPLSTSRPVALQGPPHMFLMP